jgi:hypothetical protein
LHNFMRQSGNLLIGGNASMPNNLTASELLAVHILDAALQRAHRAADLATVDHPELDVEISITSDVGRLDLTDLVPIRFFVSAAPPGACKSGNLLAVETTATMVRSIRSAVEWVVAEVARMEAENPGDCELPADVNPPNSSPPVLGRSAESEVQQP